jgi:hypothetical protein
MISINRVFYILFYDNKAGLSEVAQFWADGAKEEEKEDEKKGGLSYTHGFSKWLLDEETKTQRSLQWLSGGSKEILFSKAELFRRSWSTKFFYPKAFETDYRFQDDDWF